MLLYNLLKNSHSLRAPLLALSRSLLLILKTGPILLRRAAYDAMPIPYLVTGHPEKFIVSTTDLVIGRELFLHGEFDFYKLQKALEILANQGIQPPDHLIDVGANIGTIVIPALKRGLFNSATTIEPHPANLRLLKANLALNGIDSCVEVLEQAVGDTSNQQLFLQESTTNSGNHSINMKGIPVLSSRLDDLSLPSQSLLWMDIEGYEGHALSGATNLLATGIPVVCEFNPKYLQKSGGLNFFKVALKDRTLFDLQSKDFKKVTIDDLLLSLGDNNSFTDIIAIKIPQ